MVMDCHTRANGGAARVVAMALAAGLMIGCATGCVERTISINTEPEGATVILNDQEIGRSPVKVPFTWYGDYDIIVRKPGYETMKTNHKLSPPWYQYPFIDIFAECFVPFTVYDNRELDTLVLEPRRPVDRQTLLQSAEELRGRAVADTQTR